MPNTTTPTAAEKIAENLSINNKEQIFIEKYRPKNIEDLVVPETLKAQMREWVKEEQIPNLLLAGRTPGCLLPGVNIQVEEDMDLVQSRIIKKMYNLTQKELSSLRTFYGTYSEGSGSHGVYFDNNTITKAALIYAKSDTYSKKVFNNDVKYKNKHLHVSHWIQKMNLDQAVNKALSLRRYKSFFEGTPKGYINNSHLKIQFNLIYSDKLLKDLYPNIDKRITNDFWTIRGYSEEQAINKVRDIQSGYSKKRYD